MTHCHTQKGHVNDRAHHICWMITRIRETRVDKVFYTQHRPTYQRRGPKTQSLQKQKCSTSESLPRGSILAKFYLLKCQRN